MIPLPDPGYFFILSDVQVRLNALRSWLPKVGLCSSTRKRRSECWIRLNYCTVLIIVSNSCSAVFAQAATREIHLLCDAGLLHVLDRVDRLQRGLDAGCCEAAGESVFLWRPRQRPRGSLRDDRAATFQHDQDRAIVQHPQSE